MNSRERVIAALERKQPDRVPLVEWVIDEGVMDAMLPGCDYYAFNDWIGLDMAGLNRSRGLSHPNTERRSHRGLSAARKPLEIRRFDST